MVQSVDRALDILQYMSCRKSVSVTELAEEFELDKATVSRILKTLEKHGMASKCSDSAKYCIGSGVLRLSYNIKRCDNVVRAARKCLVNLADTLHTTARLCKIEGKRVFIIDQATRERIDKDTDIPGISKPLYCSAIGKIILAYMPKRKQTDLLSEMQFVQYTENTVIDKEILLAELEEIKRQGYALNRAEFSDYSYCIAVPVFGDEKREVLDYCIGITGKEDHRKNPAVLKSTVAIMQQTAAEVTKTILKNSKM